MKSFFVVLCLCSAAVSHSQQVYYPRSNYRDSIVLARTVPLLAATLKDRYSNIDSTSYYETELRLQTLARDYSHALQSLDRSIRFSVPDTANWPGMGFGFRSYLLTMLQLEKDGITSFEKKYTNVFIQQYSALSDVGGKTYSQSVWAELSLRSFHPDVLRKEYQEQITRLDSSRSDSISLGDAISFCRAYCNWRVYDAIGDLSARLMNEVEKVRYDWNDSVLVKTPDGGTISLRWVRKRTPTGPQPVALKYTIYPYDNHVFLRDAAQRGYVGVVAYTRGKLFSDNDVEPFEHDAKDAHTIIDWISKQPWCNGKIGMYGGSYAGFSQWSATKYLHPALKTIVPQVAVGIGVDYPMENNVLMNYGLRWLHYVMNNKTIDESDFRDDEKWDSVYGKWYTSGRPIRALDTLDGRPNAIFQRWLDHPSYDEYWKNMTPQPEEFSGINIPVLTITGYWDDDQLGAMYYFREHYAWNNAANHCLLVGPYDHGGAQFSPVVQLSGYRIDAVANIPIYQLVFQWFDYVMKDSSRPAILSDKVNFEVMGENKWRHVSSLEKMSNSSMVFYLSSDTTGNSYKLLSSRPSQKKYIVENVDFRDRSDTLTKESDLLVDTVLQHEKKLVFMTEPLDHQISIAGSFQGHFNVSINKKDIDIVADLYAQTPDRKYFRLNNEIHQRASYAKDRSTRHLLKPGVVEQIDLMHTFITCIQLPKGSRLIFMLGVNKNRRWQINYGTGKNVSDESIADAGEPLCVKWYTDSYIQIPIIK